MSEDWEEEDSNELPPWFTNTEDSNSSNGGGPWQAILALGIAAIVLVMLLIPVLQARVLQRQQDSLPDEDVTRTAVQFATAILLSREEGRSLIFVADEARSTARDVLATIIERETPSRGARIRLVEAQCSVAPADTCYLARVVDPVRPIATAIRFGVNSSGDGADVVWVVIDERVASASIPEL